MVPNTPNQVPHPTASMFSSREKLQKQGWYVVFTLLSAENSHPAVRPLGPPPPPPPLPSASLAAASGEADSSVLLREYETSDYSRNPLAQTALG